MSETLAPKPRHGAGPPLTLESQAFFRVHSAELHGPAAPLPTNSEVVLIAAGDDVVVFPPSERLVILAAERAKRRPVAAPPILNEDPAA